MAMRRALAVLFPLLSAACSTADSGSTGAGSRGIVAITVRIEGNGADPDGFVWSLGPGRSVPPDVLPQHDGHVDAEPADTAEPLHGEQPGSSSPDAPG